MTNRSHPITLELLEKHRASWEGRAWFSECGETDLTKVVERLFIEERHNWASWLVQTLMTDSQLRQYAIFSAESVLDIYEKRYPVDKRPRKAILAAKEYLADPSESNREKLKTARSAAYEAAVNAAYAYDAAFYTSEAAHEVPISAAQAAAFGHSHAVEAINAAYTKDEARRLKNAIFSYLVERLNFHKGQNELK